MRTSYRRKRAAVSEVVGTLVTIAITIIAGASIFSYVNNQAGVSERQYGLGVAGTVNYLQEHFVVAQLHFTTTAVTVYLYNSGQMDLNVAQVLVYNATKADMDISYSASSVLNLNNVGTSCGSVSSLESPALGNGSSAFFLSSGSVGSFTLTLPSSCYTGQFVSGDTYTVEVIGQYGNTVTYYQVM